MVKRLDNRRTMVLGTALLGVSALGFLLIHSAGPLAAVLRGLQGIAWSLTFAAGMSLVAEVAPPIRLGHGIGLYGAVALRPAPSAPAIAEPIATRFGARPLFLISAVGRPGRRAGSAAACPPARACFARPRGEARVRARCAAARRVIGVLAVGSLASAAVSTFVAPFALDARDLAPCADSS